MDLHSFVGGKQLPTGCTLYILQLEVHALHMGVQPVLVDELSRAGRACVGILLKIARWWWISKSFSRLVGVVDIPTFWCSDL